MAIGLGLAFFATCLVPGTVVDESPKPTAPQVPAQTKACHDPDPSVASRSPMSEAVSIGGCVTRPGWYLIAEDTTLVEIIERAGGPNKNGSHQSINVYRDKKNTFLHLTEDEIAEFVPENYDMIEIPPRSMDPLHP